MTATLITLGLAAVYITFLILGNRRDDLDIIRTALFAALVAILVNLIAGSPWWIAAVWTFNASCCAWTLYIRKRIRRSDEFHWSSRNTR